jgi:pimeloyl-ACP methyl ester carboxylesterase
MNQAKQTNITAQDPQLFHVVCPGASTLDAGTHRMAYWSWGDVSNKRTLLCVHGLSRQGRDFDVLARRLSAHYHVVCPDVVGRGQSDWLADAKGYQVFSYASDMIALGQALKAAKGIQPEDGPLDVDWVGTSMGGLIGLGFSSLPPEASGLRIRRMVLNDVGPRLRIEALLRIGAYLGLPKVFATEQEAADYLWSISTGFGPHTPQQWLDLCLPLLKPAAGGTGLMLRYDPAIAEPFKAMTAESATAGEAMVWQVYDNLKAETLLLRGADSDLLDAATAQEMTQRGPKAKLVSFEGVGHAPTLIAEDQVSAVEGFLLA